MNNFTNDEPKYRKKSTAKGQPRSKHKHIYETVLLTRCYPFNLGGPRDSYQVLPTRVCNICGRIDSILWDEEYYVPQPGPGIRYPRELSEKALKLPKWYCNDFDKFAVKDE